VVPLGARKPLATDARIVSATNRELARKVQEGRFRADLYYRLAGIVIEIPPLRSHPEDVPLLVTSFLQREAERWQKPLRGLSERALRALVAYSWPGNIRQLEHEVRRLVAACPPGGLVTYELLSPEIKAAGVGTESEPAAGSLRQRVAQLERELISEALRARDGSLREAAKLLGMSRYGLSLKLKRLGLSAGETPRPRSRRPRR
jgi:two-component system response regulator HupR/HoxA